MPTKTKITTEIHTIGYIAEIAEELASLAHNAGEGALAHILRLAVEEAKLILKKSRQKKLNGLDLQNFKTGS